MTVLDVAILAAHVTLGGNPTKTVLLYCFIKMVLYVEVLVNKETQGTTYTSILNNL